MDIKKGDEFELKRKIWGAASTAAGENSRYLYPGATVKIENPNNSWMKISSTIDGKREYFKTSKELFLKAI